MSPQYFSIYISASWTTSSNIYEYATYIGPQLLCGIYCLVVVVAVSMKLKLDSMRLDRQIEHRKTGERSDVDIRRRKTQKAINRVVRRILLYPLVPIITQSEFQKKRIAVTGLVSKSVERCHALSRCFNMALSSSLILIIVAFFYSSWLHRQWNLPLCELEAKLSYKYLGCYSQSSAWILQLAGLHDRSCHL